MDAVSVTDLDLASLADNGKVNVALDGSYFKQTKLIKPNNNNVINLCCVYSLERITNLRNTDYTVQNALFGGVKINKNSTDTSKHKYEGYGICFDECGTFSKSGINNGKNVMIFGVHENSLTHANNKANNVFVMGDFIVQGINDTTLYAEKVYSQNFTAPDKKFVLSLHYNGDNSCLFVNGKQEFKFAGKIDCKKGYMWNPTTCACECDLWCKQGQYLDYKNCVCKNKIIGKVYASCSSFINENMTKVDKNGKIVNEDSSFNIYAALFSLTMLILIVGFGIFVYRRWFKDKKWFSGIFTIKTQDKNLPDVS